MSLTRKDIADMIYPDVTQTIADYQQQYPQRPIGQVVSRIAPSPTGFLHIGSLYSAFVAWKFVQQQNGVFFLRIEDTDQKREVSGAIDMILANFRTFGVTIDEGPLGDDNSDIGNYGPYIQSYRRPIYQTFVKHLIAEGKAYPCWMSTEEIDAIRQSQERSKQTPGIYGNYSLWRNKTPDEIAAQLAITPAPVIRLRSHGNLHAKVTFTDGIKGTISMIDNYNDTVLIKSDGLPTYHLAHLVDDYLMGTTHVIRWEEWLTSVPLHIQLFQAFDFKHPQYCHIAPLLKDDNGKKRKLSKRHDPEANVAYFWEQWFSVEGIIDYMMFLIDSSYEDFLKQSSSASFRDFVIHLDKMNNSGALFDIQKLRFFNTMYLSKISNQDLFNQTLVWAKQYDSVLAGYMETQADYALAALSIERLTEKDPKRYASYADISPNILFFFDDQWEKMDKPSLPDFMTPDLLQNFVATYITQLDLTVDTQTWFDQLKSIGKEFGFAANNQEFKEGWYIGKIGDLAMFLRVQLCRSTKTPDLYSVMQVMGKDRVVKRLQAL